MQMASGSYLFALFANDDSTTRSRGRHVLGPACRRSDTLFEHADLHARRRSDMGVRGRAFWQPTLETMVCECAVARNSRA